MAARRNSDAAPPAASEPQAPVADAPQSDPAPTEEARTVSPDAWIVPAYSFSLTVGGVTVSFHEGRKTFVEGSVYDLLVSSGKEFKKLD